MKEKLPLVLPLELYSKWDESSIDSLLHHYKIHTKETLQKKEGELKIILLESGGTLIHQTPAKSARG